MIVGNAAPMEVYKLVNLNVTFDYLPAGGVTTEKGRLTNSMAVRRMDSAREKMMHQNFQSFGTGTL